MESQTSQVTPGPRIPNKDDQDSILEVGAYISNLRTSQAKLENIQSSRVEVDRYGNILWAEVGEAKIFYSPELAVSLLESEVEELKEQVFKRIIALAIVLGDLR